MNRSTLARELKAVGVRLDGWMPVVQCDVCENRWEPFAKGVGSSAATARFDYWKCPNGCNASEKLSRQTEAVIPRYVVISDIPGMVFGEDDLAEFKRYALSMDATQIPNKNI
jgi:hypothetical protein